MSQSGRTCTTQTPFTAIDDDIAASLGVHCDAANAFKAEIEVTHSRLQLSRDVGQRHRGKAQGPFACLGSTTSFDQVRAGPSSGGSTISAPSGCRALSGWRMGRPFAAMYHAHPMPNSAARADGPTRFQSSKRRMLPASQSSCRFGWRVC